MRSDMTANSRKSKSGGCGCGCGGAKASPTANCTCGARPDCPDSGILRPNFFAGQLLTEDDLQQITVYQNNKRRLTNRYVIGTGVVCGLKVKLGEPDAPSAVTVQPGYALDCCGNDIVLNCPYTFDVISMIREEGLDCGNPCAEASGDEDKPNKYWLYVKYDEFASEPISPYSPDGSTSCVNTRVQESCTFELRCPPKNVKASGDFASRLRQVFDDAALANRIDVQRWRDLLAHKSDLFNNVAPVNPTPAEAQSLQADVPAALDRIVATLVPENWTEEKLEQAVKDLLGPARTVLRVLFIDPQKRNTLDAGRRLITTGGTLTATTDLLAAACKKLSDAGNKLGGLIWSHFSAPVQTRATLLVEEISRWTVTDSAKVDSLRHRVDTRLFVLDQPAQTDAQSLAPEPYSFKRYASVLLDLSERFAWAKAPTGPDFTADGLAALQNNIDTASRAIDSARRNALCELLNPPCTPCNDLGVLLAVIEVKACKVITVCNLVRKIILSPAALAYWLPLQEVVAALCCGDAPLDRQMDRLNEIIRLYTRAGGEFIVPERFANPLTPLQGART